MGADATTATGVTGTTTAETTAAGATGIADSRTGALATTTALGSAAVSSTRGSREASLRFVTELSRLTAEVTLAAGGESVVVLPPAAVEATRTTSGRLASWETA